MVDKLYNVGNRISLGCKHGVTDALLKSFNNILENRRYVRRGVLPSTPDIDDL